MAISRFQSRFKTRTDLMDHITPNNTVQMNASVPHGEWAPANWLPVVWQNEKSKDYFVMSAGKVVSLDRSGRVVPAGLLRRALDASAATDTVLTYTANDVEARVVDIRTGAFVAAAAVLDLEAFTDALVANGWVAGFDNNDFASAAEIAADGTLAGDDLAARKACVEFFISAPVGILAYDVYVWAGDDPASLHFTNYQKQHLIQFFTDIQMKVAHVCADAVAVAVAGLSRVNGAALAVMPRYAGLDMSSVVAFDLELGKLASSVSRTPVSFSAFAGRQRSDISLLAKAGDWYLDADAGMILFFEDGGNADPVGTDGVAFVGTISVFPYDGAVSAQERMVMMVGDCRPGDFVSFDEMSNFKVASTDDHDAHLVVGRLLAMYKEPRGLLERVRTGWKGDEFDATSKMPGSATEGFSDLITLSSHHGENVADEIAVINVKLQ
jgi:hypothetical protein